MYGSTRRERTVCRKAGVSLGELAVYNGASRFLLHRNYFICIPEHLSLYVTSDTPRGNPYLLQLWVMLLPLILCYSSVMTSHFIERPPNHYK
jgi:hypothetical protein